MPKSWNEDALLQLVVAPQPRDRKFRSFMMKLAKELKEDDLSQLKYALKKSIPRGKMENLRTPLEVFTELEERNLVGPGKLDHLQNLLEDIDRPNLLSMVDDYNDSGSAYPLKPKSDNYLEMDGYRVEIKGGRHFETTEGEFVEVRSGTNYALTVTNMNNHRCQCNIKIDGYDMFPGGLLFNPKEEGTVARPFREEKKFKFFAIADAPHGSGINKWRNELNGIIQVVFTPEKADMKVICVAKGAGIQVISFSHQTTDSDLYEMVSTSFGATCATIMINNWKPLSTRGMKLFEYGIQDGSRVDVNLGGRGGVSMKELLSIQNMTPSKKNVKWRAGATTLEDESKQEFRNHSGLPLDPTLAVSLNLRLVAREDEIPTTSTGKCTPLARATLIPPPVPT